MRFRHLVSLSARDGQDILIIPFYSQQNHQKYPDNEGELIAVKNKTIPTQALSRYKHQGWCFVRRESDRSSGMAAGEEWRRQRSNMWAEPFWLHLMGFNFLSIFWIVTKHTADRSLEDWGLMIRVCEPSLANRQVPGQTCDATSVTLTSGQLSDYPNVKIIKTAGVPCLIIMQYLWVHSPLRCSWC